MPCYWTRFWIVTIHHSPDGANWTKGYVQMEVSGYHHNVAYDFLSLRPGIYAAGDGEVRFRNLAYRALPCPARPKRAALSRTGLRRLRLRLELRQRGAHAAHPANPGMSRPSTDLRRTVG